MVVAGSHLVEPGLCVKSTYVCATCGALEQVGVGVWTVEHRRSEKGEERALSGRMGTMGRLSRVLLLLLLKINDNKSRQVSKLRLP